MKTWAKSYGKLEGGSGRWGYITDEHRHNNIVSQGEADLKELSQFDNKKPEELESEFDHFDPDNSYSSSPFKGRNIVDLDFVYKQLLDGHKACRTTLSLT